jgi:ribosome-associated translation inhibitor RaiA
MRIKVSGVNVVVSNESRRYAEYRLFTSIAPHDSVIRAVDVTLGCDSFSHRPFICTVTVELGASGRIKTQARAAYPSAAIDRAAERAAWLLRRRAAQDFTLKSPAFSS